MEKFKYADNYNLGKRNEAEPLSEEKEKFDLLELANLERERLSKLNLNEINEKLAKGYEAVTELVDKEMRSDLKEAA